MIDLSDYTVQCAPLSVFSVSSYCTFNFLIDKSIFLGNYLTISNVLSSCAAFYYSALIYKG